MSNVTATILFPDKGLIRCVSPTRPGVDPVAWATEHREELTALLPSIGGVLFRGFGVADADSFERLVKVFATDTLDYRYGSSPRTREAGNVFTSTEYPATEKIPLHNEMSYTSEWPLKLWFYCQVAPAVGGETPLADSHRVYERIPAAIRDRFDARRVRYVRNYSTLFDLTWQKTFRTDSKADVEAYCRRRGIAFEWLDDGLRTVEICQASAPHPVTGERLWMNQAHLFHISAQSAEVREYLEDAFTPDTLPRNAYFGDGAPIPDEDLTAIRAAYDAEEFMFPWQVGDVLLLDNLALAHARSPFQGPRKILVAMTDAFDALAASVRRSPTPSQL